MDKINLNDYDVTILSQKQLAVFKVHNPSLISNFEYNMNKDLIKHNLPGLFDFNLYINWGRERTDMKFIKGVYFLFVVNKIKSHIISASRIYIKKTGHLFNLKKVNIGKYVIIDTMIIKPKYRDDKLIKLMINNIISFFKKSQYNTLVVNLKLTNALAIKCYRELKFKCIAFDDIDCIMYKEI